MPPLTDGQKCEKYECRQNDFLVIFIPFILHERCIFVNLYVGQLPRSVDFALFVNGK
jgi:hypothetical protein